MEQGDELTSWRDRGAGTKLKKAEEPEEVLSEEDFLAMLPEGTL